MTARWLLAAFLGFLLSSCGDVADDAEDVSGPNPPPVRFTHVADNQTLHPNADASPGQWLVYPESFGSGNPRTTYMAIDEPVSQSGINDWIHACQCENGCQAQQYTFSDYSGSGPIEVHDIIIRMDVQGCLDGYNFCSGAGEPVVMWIEASYYIQGSLQGTRQWYHFAGGSNCADGVWEEQFSNLSYNRGQINSLEVRVKIGGQPFCENSTLATVWSLEVECIAGEVHQGGCHCEPDG